MKKKKNSKTLIVLLVIVVILLGALELIEYYGKEKTRENLTGVKIDKITRIALSKSNDDQYISLKKEELGWFITSEKIQIPIENQQIEKIFQLLTEMKPIKKISSNNEDWEKHETTDEQSLRVTTYREKDILSDIFIGCTEKDETTGELITYVRVKGDQDIYSVKGNLHHEFEQNFFEQIFPIN